MIRSGNCSAKTRKLDFALAMISAIRAKHHISGEMSLREIAALTQVIVGRNGGCSWENIQQIEKRALRKVRQRLSEDGTIGALELGHFRERKITA